MEKTFPFEKQLYNNDCGPTSLWMLTLYYHLGMSRSFVYENCIIKESGVSLLSLSECANKLGFHTLPIECSLEVFLQLFSNPIIAIINKSHYVVIYDVCEQYIWISDPASEQRKYTYEDFEKIWYNNNEKGIIIDILLPKMIK